MLALFRDAFARHGEALLAALPALLVAAAAIGFHLTTTNPFNPLQLQNPATWQPQLWNIAGYYAGLLPFFFPDRRVRQPEFRAERRPHRPCLWLRPDRRRRRRGLGAGGDVRGACVLPGAAAAGAAGGQRLLRDRTPSLGRHAGRRRRADSRAEALLLLDNQAQFNDFKAIYAPLHTPDARIVAKVLSPRGDYTLLDDFTERVDTDISNNAGMLGLPGPPQTFGLYRDGNRIAALPKPGPIDADYAAASLDALPYELIPHANVLLAGRSGGFRIAEVLALGAAKVRVLEPEPVLLRALQHGLGSVAAMAADPRVRPVRRGARLPRVHDGAGYDIIDLSADFLDAAEANATAFTVSRRSPTTCARSRRAASSRSRCRSAISRSTRCACWRRRARRLLRAGIADPAHIWSCIAPPGARASCCPTSHGMRRGSPHCRKFCDDRSFDVSWYPGIDPSRRAPTSTTTCRPCPSPAARSPRMGRTMRSPTKPGRSWPMRRRASRAAFNLSPITLDRPFFYAVLRLDQLGTILKRLEILPQARDRGAGESGGAGAGGGDRDPGAAGAACCATPRLRRAGDRAAAADRLFPGARPRLPVHRDLPDREGEPLAERPHLGLRPGADRHAGVLRPGQHAGRPAWRLPTPRRSCWHAWSSWLGASPRWPACSRRSWPRSTCPGSARAALVLAVLAPVSVALGLPFPLGLARTGSGGLLPWAWGLNGAFSVVATPLANLIAREAGFSRVLLCAAMLYVMALVTFPAARKSRAWQHVSARSRAAELIAAAGALCGRTSARHAADAWTREAYRDRR